MQGRCARKHSPVCILLAVPQHLNEAWCLCAGACLLWNYEEVLALMHEAGSVVATFAGHAHNVGTPFTSVQFASLQQEQGMSRITHRLAAHTIRAQEPPSATLAGGREWR